MTEGRALVDEVAALLSEKGVRTAAREAVAREAAAREAVAREAEWLAEAATGLARHELARAGRVGPYSADRARRLARRRAAGEPLQYLTGVAGFRRLELAVGPGVMIPRPETETTAEIAMHALPEGGRLVDVGTGCGAIALSIADERPDALVLATEISPDALAWAERNRAATGLGVELIACDLLSGLPVDVAGRLDVVVSNPPYVAVSERDSLPREVVDFEPQEALFAGEDGLAVIRRLAEGAPEWLAPGGTLVLEIGATQGAAAGTLLKEAGYGEVRVERDLAGRERVVVGRSPR
jgi:release factor glutamine methyltransferase